MTAQAKHDHKAVWREAMDRRVKVDIQQIHTDALAELLKFKAERAIYLTIIIFLAMALILAVDA